ncbi:hypothetical protein M569_03472 [Genlisea aurea]|uniref:Polygalacturonase n=1 Tax=Genlisea aurea TaxID=192259 RepID=S8CV93_9LAMI|nr:hypothetical protein M569_03472 [Genlisea aurea]
MVTHSTLNNLHFVNSMGFHTKVTDSQNVVVERLTITAPGDSPNTDGIHLSKAKNITVSNLVIGTGDDCVSIGHGVVDSLITGVTCGPGHGLSVGSLGKRDNEMNLSGIKVINCTITKATNGVRIKTFADSPELQATGIIFQDIIMNEVANPIIIDQHYHSSAKKESNVKLSDIHFINISGTTVTPDAIQLDCSKTHPCDKVELANIDLQPAGNAKTLTATCANAATTIKGTTNPPMPESCS